MEHMRTMFIAKNFFYFQFLTLSSEIEIDRVGTASCDPGIPRQQLACVLLPLQFLARIYSLCLSVG